MKQTSLQQRIIHSSLLILMLFTILPTQSGFAEASVTEADFSDSGFASVEKSIAQTPATLPVFDRNYKAGELLVRLRPGVIVQSAAQGIAISAAGVDALFQKYNVSAADPLFPNSETTPQGLERTYKVTVSPQADMLSFLAELSADTSVEYAEPNYLYQVLGFRDPDTDDTNQMDVTTADLATNGGSIAPSSFVTDGMRIPSDPYFSVEWGLHNVLSTGKRIGADIQAPIAWNLFTGTNATTNTVTNTVLIAIIDSGVDYTHEDLNDGRVRTDIDHDYVNKDDDALDDNGHGTHVAGTIAAETDNGIGIAGIVWQAEILPLKVCDDSGSCGLDYIVSAIKYAADHGARVINMSLGSDSCSETLEDAIDYAYFQKGVVVVAAAGNNNGSVGYPAKYEPVLAVGAIDRHSQRAYFSDNGPALDLVAPGVRVFSTLPHNSYEAYSGTSMASPHVAGVAALLIAQRPTLTNNQVRQILLDSASDLGSIGKDYYFGMGVVNAAAALQASAPISPTIPDISRCVAEECSGEATVFGESDAFQLLQTLRAVRDQIFAQQAFSQRWSDIYYQNQSEVFWRVLADDELRSAALTAMRTLEPALGSLLNADGSSLKVTNEMVTNADTVISLLIEKGSASLSNELRQQWNQLDAMRFVGMDIGSAWQQVKEESGTTKTYLPLIGK